MLKAAPSARRSIQKIAEALRVRQQIAWPDAVDVLWRQRDADDAEVAAVAVDDRADDGRRADAALLGKRFADQHLVRLAGLRLAAAAQEHVVQRPAAAESPSRSGGRSSARSRRASRA